MPNNIRIKQSAERVIRELLTEFSDEERAEILSNIVERYYCLKCGKYKQKKPWCPNCEFDIRALTTEGNR